MQEIVTRAGCFIAIIVLGYALRKINFFKEGDFRVLSGIVIKITLPAAIVYNFSGKEIDTSLLFIVLLGLGGGLITVGCFFLLPFSLEVRQALMILAFSPIASAAPAFTQELEGDVGLASALNSLSIVISIVCIVGLLVVTL